MTIPDWVVTGIDKAWERETGTVTPTRYPFTYAYDFLRSHADAFGIPIPGEEWGLSRGATASWLRAKLGVDSRDELYRKVCEQLADEYIKQWRLEWPDVP